MEGQSDPHMPFSGLYGASFSSLESLGTLSQLHYSSNNATAAARYTLVDSSSYLPEQHESLNCSSSSSSDLECAHDVDEGTDEPTLAEQYQAALTHNDVPKLRATFREFVSRAESFGRIIIAERLLPLAKKSIKPVSLGGVAGGTKFIANELLFKFAADVALNNDTFLYGNKERDDAAAHKAAGHERKSLAAIAKVAHLVAHELAPSLLTVVDFHGVRLGAQLLLPISRETLVYGSSNAGHTVVQDASVLGLVQRISDHLKLAAHRYVDPAGREHMLRLPVDIELHRSMSNPGTFYMLDAARLMPPMTPTARSQDVFVKLFRPEFLLAYPTPLSSDAFSGFGAADRAQEEAVRVATLYFHNTHVPWASRQAVRNWNGHDQGAVVPLLQALGVNARFLGAVRDQLLGDANATDLRVALAIEMMARTLKTKIRAKWRTCRGRSGADDEYVSSALQMLGQPCVSADDLKAKYGTHVHEPPPWIRVVQRTAQLVGIDLKDGVLESGSVGMFDVSLRVVVKSLRIGEVLESDALVAEACTKEGAAKIELLRRARTNLLVQSWCDRDDRELAIRLAKVNAEIVAFENTDAAFRAFEEHAERWSSNLEVALLRVQVLLRRCRHAASQLYVSVAVDSFVRAHLALRELSQAVDKIPTFEADLNDALAVVIASARNASEAESLLSSLRALILERPASLIYVLQNQSHHFFLAASLSTENDDLLHACGSFVNALGLEGVVKVLDLTLRPLDEQALTVLAPFLRRTDRLCFENVIAAKAESLVVCLGESVSTLHFEYCAFLDSDAVETILQHCRVLKDFATRYCGRLRGSGLWRLLPETLEALDVTSCYRLSFAAIDAAPLPRGLTRLMIENCPELDDARFWQSIPRGVRVLHANCCRENTWLPEALEELHLTKQTFDIFGTATPLRLPNLKRFVGHPGFTDAGIQALLLSSPHLEDMDVSDCAGVTTAPLGFRRLQAVNLSRTSVVAENFDGPAKVWMDGVLRFSLSPESHRALEELSCWTCNDAILCAIASTSSHSLRLCSFASMHGVSSVDPLFQFSLLQQIELRDCRCCTDAHLAAIVQRNPNLKRLSLFRLPQLTGSFFEAFVEHRLEDLSLELALGQALHLRRAFQHGKLRFLRRFMFSKCDTLDDCCELLSLYSPLIVTLCLHLSTVMNFRDANHFLCKLPKLRSVSVEFSAELLIDLVSQGLRMRVQHLKIHAIKLEPALMQILCSWPTLNTLHDFGPIITAQCYVWMRDNRVPLFRHFAGMTDSRATDWTNVVMENVPSVSEFSALCEIVDVLNDSTQAKPLVPSGFFPVDDLSIWFAKETSVLLASWTVDFMERVLQDIAWNGKTAFLPFYRDEVTFNILRLVLLNGYRCVVACLSDEVSVVDEIDASYVQQWREWKSERLVWQSVDPENEKSLGLFRERCASAAPNGFDLSLVFWPLCAREVFICQMSISSLLPDVGFSSVELFPLFLRRVFAIFSCISPSILRCSNGPRVAVWVSGLASISQNTSGRVYGSRAFAAGLLAIIKSFSLEIAHKGGVCAGIAPGFWFPGCPKRFLNSAFSEIAETIFQTAIGLRVEQNGHLLDSTGKIVPP